MQENIELMTLEIFSRRQAEKYHAKGPWMLLSFHDPDRKPFELRHSGIVPVRINIACDDILEEEHHWMKPFTEDQASECAHFIINEIDNVSTIVTNCEAGMCRSAGAMRAICTYFDWDDTVCYQAGRQPNLLVYRRLFAALEKLTPRH